MEEFCWYYFVNPVDDSIFITKWTVDITWFCFQWLYLLCNNGKEGTDNCDFILDLLWVGEHYLSSSTDILITAAGAVFTQSYIYNAQQECFISSFIVFFKSEP